MRSDHRHLLAGALLGRQGHHPALVEALVDDRGLDGLDGHRGIDDAEHARALAGRGADAARELREVVRLMEAVQRVLPAAAVDEVVPLRDQVVDGTAGGQAGDHLARVAKGRAAVHAAGTLVAQLLGRELLVELGPVLDALERAAVRRQLARELEEARGLAHDSYLPPTRATSWALSSKAAISASSGLRPVSRILRWAWSTRL
jgi:hypothetical protein